MPNIITRLLDGAAGGYAKSFPFGGGAASGGGLASAPAFDLNALVRDRVFWQNTPGSNRNWQGVIGERHLCSVVGICLNWYIGTIQAAPAYVAIKKGKDKTPVDRHPMEQLIRRPNEFYSGSLLWAGTLFDYRTRGNAYWFKVRDKLGRVVRLWWIPAILVRPTWSAYAGAEFIDGYIYTVGKKQTSIATKDVIHFKHGLDYGSMGRLGLDPLAPVLRSIGAVNSAENFTASLLMNNATPGMLVTPDPSLFKPDSIVDQAAFTAATDPQYIKDLIIDRTSGDNVGKPLVLDVPYVLQKMGFSPEELALDKMQSVPVETVCAAMGLSPMTVNLPSSSKTYSNYAEANEAAWRDGVLPMHANFGEALDVQLLPDFDRRDNVSTEWDYSGVLALQEDKDATWNRALEAWKGNGIDRATYKQAIGHEPEPEDEGLYYADIAPAGSGGFDGTQGQDSAGAVPPAENPGEKPPKDTKPEQDAPDAGKSIKSNDAHWITVDGRHINLSDPSTFPPGFTGQDVVGEQEPVSKRSKSEIAKASASRTDRNIQQYTEERNEPILAKGIAGVHIPGNAPVDVSVSREGILTHGVELKTMVSNKAGKITMCREALELKAEWVQQNKTPLSTVVFDDRNVFNANGPGKHDESKREMYYRRGAGSFELTAMHKVPDFKTLVELLNTADADLPVKARPPKSYVPPPARKSVGMGDIYGSVFATR